MTALGRVVRAGVGRRRLQTAVLVLTTLIAVAASLLAAGLLIASNAPFDHGFAEQQGAHLVAQFNGAEATADQLAATARTPGVTAAAGPYRTVTTSPSLTNAPGAGGLADLPPMTVVGRAGPGGPVDDLTLVSGHWPRGPGEIVLAASGDLPPDADRLTFPNVPGRPTLTVVGRARSVSETADAWVTPAGLRELTVSAAAPQYQMLYRFAHAGTAAAVAADRRAIAAAVPHEALTGTQSWLAVKQVQSANTAAFVPFVVAFGVLGLVLSVLIITSVVGGAVGSATRRIGILKALGFTPGQVVRAYVAQAAIPAGIGVVLGALVGNLLAIPVLHGAENGFNSTGFAIPLWIDVMIPGAALVVVTLAALLPALRAGRLSAVQALAVGRTPGAGRGRRAQRIAGRLPIPRTIGLGVANPFVRVSRSSLTGATILFGTVTVTLAVGLALSLNDVQNHRALDSAGAVLVDTGGGGIAGGNAVRRPAPGSTPTAPADPRVVAAAIAAQPGTRSYYGTAWARVHVGGIAGTTNVRAYEGDASWATADQLVSGHWLRGKNDAVVTGRFLTAAGVQVGDTLTISAGARSTRVQIVGEIFALEDDGMDLLTSTATLAALGQPARVTEFQVELRPGTDLHSYLAQLTAALPTGVDAVPSRGNHSDVIAAMDALIALLTIMLVAVAALGVLNTVMLDTRDRTHDLGIVKALGMTPRQTVAMVLTSVGAIGLLGAGIGVPIGIALHHIVVPVMADSTGEHLPRAFIAVYGAGTAAALIVGGLLIAASGALPPAGWAAKIRPTAALRTE